MIRATLPALVAICYAAFNYTAAQTPRVELDHLFVVVQPGAAAEIAALQSAGFTVAPGQQSGVPISVPEWMPNEGLQPTASSVCPCIAPAFGSG